MWLVCLLGLDCLFCGWLVGFGCFVVCWPFVCLFFSLCFIVVGLLLEFG